MKSESGFLPREEELQHSADEQVIQHHSPIALSPLGLNSQFTQFFLKTLAMQSNCRRSFGDVPIVLAELAFDE